MAFKRIKRGLRICKIAFVIKQEGLDNIICSAPLLRKYKFLTWANPFWFCYHKKDRGIRVREALEKLGPIFVKFGQLLSTRRDIIPEDVADELAKLQDKVPPFPAEIAKKIISKSLKQPISDVFDDFNPEALASASIAQVHTARLKNGQEIIIKVLRPNIKKIVTQDLGLLESLAKTLEKLSPFIKKFNMLELVREAKYHMLNEIDLIQEAANACQIRRNFNKSKILYIPKIHWDYCSEKIMVMERIYGVPIKNITELKRNKVDMTLLATRGIELFYTQVFRDKFFHADMHPGNLFIDITNPKNPKYIAVDFGLVGTLNNNDQYYLAANLLAFLNKNYREVAKLHVSSGWVDPNTNIEAFESAIRAVCEPILDRPIQEVSLADTLVRLLQIAQKFKMNIQPQLLMLQKTLLNIEGIARQICPDLDVWKIGKPFLEEWMKNQVGIRSIWNKSKKNYPFISAKFPELPIMLYDIIENMHKKYKYDENYNPYFQKQITQSKSKNKKHQNIFAKLLSGIGIILMATAGILYLDNINPNQIDELKHWILMHPNKIAISGFVILLISWHCRKRD